MNFISSAVSRFLFTSRRLRGDGPFVFVLADDVAGDVLVVLDSYIEIRDFVEKMMKSDTLGWFCGEIWQGEISENVIIKKLMKLDTVGKYFRWNLGNMKIWLHEKNWWNLTPWENILGEIWAIWKSGSMRKNLWNLTPFKIF